MPDSNGDNFTLVAVHRLESDRGFKPARLLKPLLVRNIDGRLNLTAIGRERYRQISGTLAPGRAPDEINAAVVNFLGEPR